MCLVSERVAFVVCCSGGGGINVDIGGYWYSTQVDGARTTHIACSLGPFSVPHYSDRNRIYGSNCIYGSVLTSL